MQMERSRNNRRRSMPRSHSYVGKHTAEDVSVRICRISERQKQLDDISKVGEHEICIQESRILV